MACSHCKQRRTQWETEERDTRLQKAEKEIQERTEQTRTQADSRGDGRLNNFVESEGRRERPSPVSVSAEAVDAELGGGLPATAAAAALIKSMGKGVGGRGKKDGRGSTFVEGEEEGRIAWKDVHVRRLLGAGQVGSFRLGQSVFVGILMLETTPAERVCPRHASAHADVVQQSDHSA
eukprot:1523305-Rhodomonas_salina.2